jgi:tetratricopeptide (TPR) repeat protein
MGFDSRMEELDSLWKKTKNFDYRIDYGVLLVLKGEYEKAEKLFLSIEKKKPGMYATAANVGTLYELMGKNELALQWIKKAVAIDPMSHNGSEWIHVKILEAKIGGDSLATGRFLLNVNFGTGEVPVSDLKPDSLEKLRLAIYYQLNERVYFIRPEDKIVAALMFELANVTWITGREKEAHAIYQLARDYGLKDELLEKRTAHSSGKSPIVKVPHAPELPNNKAVQWIVISSVSVVVLGIAAFLYTRKRRRGN